MYAENHDATAASELQDAASDGAPQEPPSSSGGAAVILGLAVGFALTFSFLCSIFESVLLSVSRAHVETMSKTGSRAGELLQKWKTTDIERPIAAILILNTLAHTVGATVAGSSYESVFDASTLWIFSLVFTLAVLILTEIIPKTLGVAFADRLAGPVTVAVGVLVTLMKPVLVMTSWMSKLLTGGHEVPSTSVEEIRLLAAIGHRDGHVGPRIAQFIEGVASLKELKVHDVMVPRQKIAFLSGQLTFDENWEIVRKSGHSRFPFTETGDLDKVDGVILAKALAFFDHDSSDGAEPNWDSLKQPLLVVTEGKPLDQVMHMFQDQRKHLAVVVGEYGGTRGVVTLEDVLEEIVGEIEDETDRQEESLIHENANGMFLCRGTAETRKLFKLLGIETKVDSVTVGGLVAEVLGRVPREGDVAHWETLELRVTKASKRRAERVEVTVVGKDAVDKSNSEPPESQ